MADPTPSFDRIYVKDEGNSVLVTWRLYHKLLPQHLFLTGKHPQAISFDDPHTLIQNLGDLASVAFLLTVDGAARPLLRIALDWSPYGGKICWAHDRFGGCSYQALNESGATMKN